MTPAEFEFLLDVAILWPKRSHIGQSTRSNCPLVTFSDSFLANPAIDFLVCSGLPRLGDRSPAAWTQKKENSEESCLESCRDMKLQASGR
jgi:hypothetical protein